MTTQEIVASPTKLRSGNWGARVKGADVSEGDTITIKAKSGKTWTARVERVVWSGKGVSICATRSLDRSPRRSDGTYTDRHGQEYCGGICPVRRTRCCAKFGPCHDCE